MPCLEDLFLISKGQPVDYQGHTVKMADHVPVTAGQKIRIVFESAAADWRQGVHLSTEGTFGVNGRLVQAAVVLWQDTAPAEVILTVKSTHGRCSVKNVWDVGDGVMHSWHNGSGMIVEETAFGRRYRCNDGRADDDFDDLIFTLLVSG